MPSNQSKDGNATSRTTCSPIADLRQYTLYPGTREGFVELFDREFVETQEAAGMRIIGQFRDLGDFLHFFEDLVSPVLKEAGTTVLASFVTEHSPNNFPRLPLREGENVFISFSGFKDLARYHEYMTALGRNARWRTEIAPAMARRIHGPPQVLRLAPTSRSQLRA